MVLYKVQSLAGSSEPNLCPFLCDIRAYNSTVGGHRIHWTSLINSSSGTQVCMYSWFLTHDTMNHCAIAMTFIRPSVCLGRACIVIIRCLLARISVYGWIVKCSGHPDTKARPPTPSRLFPVPPGREMGYGWMQITRGIVYRNTDK